MKQKDKEPDFREYRGIPSSQIPNIDIYMDQLLTFFEDAYGFFSRDSKENVLTKAMINNYVKAGIINKPTKKRYNKDLVKKLIIIYHLKQVLSIQDIKILLHEVEKTALSTADFYDKFLETEHTVYEQLEGLYSETLNEETDKENLIHTILSLSTEACAKKRLAEKLLDQLSSSTQI